MPEPITDLNSMTVASLLASGRSVIVDSRRDSRRDSRQASGALIFCTSRGSEILRIEGDGCLVRGKDFRTDDEASVAFFDCLSEALPGFLSALRRRAEDAERELAALRAPRTATFAGVSG